MNINLGEKIKRLRIAQKITQSDLAKRVGVTPSAISSYEIMDRQPSYDVLINLATVFNVTPNYLLGYGDEDFLNVSGLNAKQRNVLSDLVADYRKLNDYNRRNDSDS